MKKTVWGILLLAYFITWIGGGLAHSYQMSRLAADLYHQAEYHNTQQLNWARLNGDREKPFQIELLPSGPNSSVNWCIPVFPGVLLADSHYVVGPLFAKGSTKIVIFYGGGSVTLWELWGWIS